MEYIRKDTINMRMAIDGHGNIYMSDPLNNHISKFAPEGDIIAQWGVRGNSEGQFAGPHGIAIDRSGNVYIADMGNRRIQKFASEGKFLASWTTYTSGGQIIYPRSIAVDDYISVYVVGTAHDPYLKRFKANGELIDQWPLIGGDPFDVAVDTSGNIYITDRSNNSVTKFKSDGTFLASWGRLDLDYKKFERSFKNSYFGKSWAKAILTTPITPFPLYPSQLSSPSYLAIDMLGYIYVVDGYSPYIKKFGPNGNCCGTFGEQGDNDGQLLNPNSIAVDRMGNFYVADGGCVHKFTSDGEFLNKCSIFSCEEADRLEG